MKAVYTRFFVRVLLFFMIIFFVIFYVSLGVRYNSETKKFEFNNVYFSFSFWNDSETVLFDNKKFQAVGHLLEIFSMPEGCYYVERKGQQRKYCTHNNNYISDAFVHHTSSKTVEFFQCKQTKPHTYSTRCVSDTICFSEDIKSTYIYSPREGSRLGFVVLGDQVLSCDTTFRRCEKLFSYTGEYQCLGENGIIVKENDKMIEYTLE